MKQGKEFNHRSQRVNVNLKKLCELSDLYDSKRISFKRKVVKKNRKH